MFVRVGSAGSMTGPVNAASNRATPNRNITTQIMSRRLASTGERSLLLLSVSMYIVPANRGEQVAWLGSTRPFPSTRWVAMVSLEYTLLAHARQTGAGGARYCE